MKKPAFKVYGWILGPDGKRHWVEVDEMGHPVNTDVKKEKPSKPE